MHDYPSQTGQAAQSEREYYPEAAIQDVRASHVTSTLLEAEEGAQHLLEAIRELESRLSDVLRPAMDSPEKAMGVPRETLVPLAERLTHHVGTVRMARQYVVSILDRLEL